MLLNGAPREHLPMYSQLRTDERYTILRTTPTRKGKMARQALDLLCTTMPTVADELGVSISTLRSWRIERRAPSAETATALAALMRRRATALVRLADKLDTTTHPEN